MAMGALARMPRNFFRRHDRWLFGRRRCLLIGMLVVIVSAESAAADDIVMTKAPAIPYFGSSAYNWNGFYAGGHRRLAP
jgi:hypothetical protein